MKNVFYLTIVIMCFTCACNEPVEESKIENDPFNFVSGDLIFQDLDCGPLCDAIESVTPGLNGQKFSHIGMFIVAGNKPYVLEATSPKVKLSRLDSFLNKSMTADGKPRIIVGRLKMDYQRVLESALRNFENYLDYPYDDTFHLDNEAYYCSELIHELFTDKSNNKSLFELAPMTFKSLNSDSFNKAWVDYYNKFNASIPEGKLGINPGLISNSDKLEFVHDPTNILK
jgi:hypothetical protein